MLAVCWYLRYGLSYRDVEELLAEHGYRAIERFGQVIDVLVAQKRDLAAAGRLFTRALGQAPGPADVRTDRAQAYPRVLDELLPTACHVLENTRIIPSNPITAA